MIIGAQGFTIRDYAQNEADFRETAKKLHDIGYKTLQVSAFGDIDPHIIREICDENGLSIIITHTNPQLILENTEKVIENHRIFGTNHVGIGMMPQKYTGSLEGMRAFLKDFGPAADKLHDAGMKLHYHNHGFEYRNLTASASSTTWRRRPTRQNGALFWTFIGRSTVGARRRYRLKKWRDALTSSTLRT